MKDTVLMVKWISHWCEVLRFHCTTLMQDMPVITCDGYEYDFT